MEYTNENLAAAIIKVDPEAREWVYNRHCKYCGRFLYPTELNCKKCKTSTSNPLERPIPFLGSASAIEKLILWAREHPNYKYLVDEITRIFIRWSTSSRDPDTYRMEIVVFCINELS